MGVPYLFYKLTQKFNITYKNTRDNGTGGSSLYCTNLYIDFNAILHGVVHELNIGGDGDDGTIVPFEMGTFLLKLDATLHDIISLTKPSSIIYIATDGVPPKAKMIQQRHRRYIGASKEVQVLDNQHKQYTLKEFACGEGVFDKNCISPGTEFMKNVSEYIKGVFIPNYKNVSRHNKIIYSTDESPSEGEHKIISYIKKNYNNQHSHIIYGLDADLLTLSTLVENKKIILLRKSKDNSHIIVHTNSIPKNIFAYISKHLEHLDLEQRDIVIDIN